MLDSLPQDARLAVRLLGRSRSFTIVAVLSLALGLGVNLSIFSFLNTLFLRPIPGVADGGRLIAIHQRTRATGAVTSASFPDFAYYHQHATSVSGLAAYATFTTTLRATDTPERARRGPAGDRCRRRGALRGRIRGQFRAGASSREGGSGHRAAGGIAESGRSDSDSSRSNGSGDR